jgi:uncharacterized protein (DUF1778 family)
MDQTHFVFSPEAYAEFLARLDAPPALNVRLQRTLNTPAPWEREPAGAPDPDEADGPA